MCIKLSWGCSALLKLTWLTQSEKVTLQIFSLMLHGPFTLPTTQSQSLTRHSYFWEGRAVWSVFHSQLEKNRGPQATPNGLQNKTHVDWDYTVGDKVLLRKDGILCKTESKYESDPWTITLVHTNGTIRVQCGTKSEWLNIRSHTLVNYVWHNYLCISHSSQKHLCFVTSSSLLSTSPQHQWHHFPKQVFLLYTSFFVYSATWCSLCGGLRQAKDQAITKWPLSGLEIPSATKVVMGKIGDPTPEECMGWFKN